MTLEQIKKAVDDGHRVYLYDNAYEVIKDNTKYLIRCLLNNNCIGLHGRVGTKFEHVANFPLSDFRIE